MSASAARRPPVATPVLGAALLVAASAAFSLGGFH